MRLVHFHAFFSNSFAVPVFVSESLAIYNQSPYEGKAKNNKQNAINPVKNMNIMRGKPVADLSGQQHFKDIRTQYPYQAGCKNDDTVVDRMVPNCRRSSDPENKNGRVQGVHKITGKKNFGIIPFPELKYLLSLFIHFHFFKEEEIDANRNQEGTTSHSDLGFILFHVIEQFSKKTAHQHEGYIADRYAEYESNSTAVSIVQALFDDGKKYGSD